MNLMSHVVENIEDFEDKLLHVTQLIRINLPLFSTVVPSSICMFLSCRPFVLDNVVITTKGLQDRNIRILDGTTVENKGKLILT